MLLLDGPLSYAPLRECHEHADKGKRWSWKRVKKRGLLTIAAAHRSICQQVSGRLRLPITTTSRARAIDSPMHPVLQVDRT
jgi:hypothetical protein